MNLFYSFFKGCRRTMVPVSETGTTPMLKKITLSPGNGIFKGCFQESYFQKLTPKITEHYIN